LKRGRSAAANFRIRFRKPKRPPGHARRPQALAAYRGRLKRRGVVRLEVHVRKANAALVRGVAAALADPDREREARAVLRERFAAGPARGLKALLAAAPFEASSLIVLPIRRGMWTCERG
jgi:hypothetical protein